MNFSGSGKSLFYKEANERALARAEEFFEEFFPGGRAVGNEWVCSSAVGGEGRSFSINMKTGRWAEFNPGAVDDDEKSRGGDVIGAIVSALGAKPHVVLEDINRWLNSGVGAGEQDDDWWRYEKADTTHTYKNADGTFFAHAYRWNAQPELGRTKIIRPWDGNNYKMPPAEPRPLLNLPEIITSTGPVVLVAGEKCVDAVAELGMLATTTFGGEAAIGKTDFYPLAGRDVILWPDNDASGNKWLERVTEVLKNVDAESVCVVPIPKGYPKKWDAADADKETRRRLLDEARSSRPVAQGLPLLRMDSLTQGEPEERRWIVNGALPQSIAAMFYGPGGCGKSMAALDLCVKVASRAKHTSVLDPECFLGCIPEDAAGPTVFITLEDDKDELHRRMKALDPERTHEDAPFYIIPGLDIEGFSPTLIKQEGYVAVLTEFAKTRLQSFIDRVKKAAGESPKLLVLDPAGDFISGDDNSAAVVEPLMLYLRTLAATNKMTILVIGHVSKGKQDGESIMSSQSRGSGAWTNKARMAFGLWRPSSGTSISFLRALGIKPNPKDIERVVFGRLTKGNFPKGNAGECKFLMHEKSGLLIDMTKAERDSIPKPTAYEAEIIRAVAKGVELNMPFTANTTATGKGAVSTGMTKRRHQLPFILQVDAPHSITEKAIKEIIARLLVEKRLVNPVGGYLDVPGGLLATAERNPPSPQDTAAWLWPEDAWD